MILVTGANGLSGSAVIREFARQHSPVRALVRSRAKARALETLPTVELVEGDMLRAETLADALDVQASERRKGSEAVVHPETYIALGIRPTTFASFARRHAADFRGESGRSRVAWGMAQT